MKVLFFSPHAYFAVHALPEALVAENLLLAGHDVTVVNCSGMLRKHCLAMSHVALDDLARKEKICSKCQRHGKAVAQEFGFPTLQVDQHIDDEERVVVRNTVQGLDRQDYLNFEINGIPLARFALYEFFLNHKLSSPDIPEDLWPEYLAMFENVLSVYYAMRRILQQEEPDRLVTYNSLYSVNRVSSAIAEQMSIPHFTLHAGRHHKRRLQQMTIFKGIGGAVLVNRLPTLEQYRASPCTIQQVDVVTEHVRELLQATSPWVYSIRSNKYASAELLGRFGIRAGQKVLLAVMRSGDERLAASFAGIGHYEGHPIFEDQYTWLSWLTDFARQHPEYVIIFRVHPREFPNKREQVTSQNALRFMRFLDGLERPANFHINLPQDNLSLHDLFKITDVLLNNTSTAALEGALFGIPAVGVGDEVFAFDQSLQDEPDSIAGYVTKIDAAVRKGWSFSQIIIAYRWLNYIFTEMAIDISDGYRVIHPSRHRSIRALNRLGREARLTIGLKGYFPEIQSRNRPLKNGQQLIYAIVNDQDSHIGAFPLMEQGDALSEQRQIAKAYRSLMVSISDPQDSLFRARFEAIIPAGLGGLLKP